MIRRFLKITVAKTQDVQRADRSFFVWMNDPDDQGWYRLRIVGVINSFMRFTGYRLYVSKSKIGVLQYEAQDH